MAVMTKIFLLSMLSMLTSVEGGSKKLSEIKGATNQLSLSCDGNNKNLDFALSESGNREVCLQEEVQLMSGPLGALVHAPSEGINRVRMRDGNNKNLDFALSESGNREVCLQEEVQLMSGPLGALVHAPSEGINRVRMRDVPKELREALKELYDEKKFVTLKEIEIMMELKKYNAVDVKSSETFLKSQDQQIQEVSFKVVPHRLLRLLELGTWEDPQASAPTEPPPLSVRLWGLLTAFVVSAVGISAAMRPTTGMVRGPRGHRPARDLSEDMLLPV